MPLTGAGGPAEAAHTAKTAHAEEALEEIREVHFTIIGHAGGVDAGKPKRS